MVNKMIDTLGIKKEIIDDSLYAIKEVEQQPQKWLETYDIIENNKEKLKDFLNNEYNVIFTGAGTSEYIGATVTRELNLKNTHHFDAIGSPDICTHPYYYFRKEKPTILVSFGRSGNSPESKGAIEHADNIFENVKHLIITCNPNGWMAKYADNNKDKALLLVMPEGTCDKSYAMTSSFTCMVLAAYLSFNLDKLEELKSDLVKVSKCGTYILENHTKLLKSFVEDFNFEKFSPLGSGTFKSLAQESVIKILEVSAGVPGTWSDSIVGYRHGPSVITQNKQKALVVMFYENNEYSNKYYDDMLEEIQTLYADRNNRVIVISPVKTEAIKKYSDLFFHIDTDVTNPVMLSLPYIIYIHLIMIYKSWTYDHGSDYPFGRQEPSYGILTKIYSIK